MSLDVVTRQEKVATTEGNLHLATTGETSPSDFKEQSATTKESRLDQRTIFQNEKPAKIETNQCLNLDTACSVSSRFFAPGTQEAQG